MNEKQEGLSLQERYPPSEPCGCEVCLSYCSRPGWWTVEEAARAMEAGYAGRMMLEISPELSFGVLSPAFKGCEGGLALNIHAQQACNFLADNLCELHGTGLMPLECRFCHHDRIGLGQQCHADIEKEWRTSLAQALIKEWGNSVGLWERLRQIRDGRQQ